LPLIPILCLCGPTLHVGELHLPEVIAMKPIAYLSERASRLASLKLQLAAAGPSEPSCRNDKRNHDGEQR
jgi:hypothetical protein